MSLSMKTTLSSLIAAACILACPLSPAASIATSIAEAEAAKPANGYVVFTYGEGWDRFGKNLMQKLIKSEALSAAVPDTVFLEFGRPELATDEEKKAFEAAKGSLKIGDPKSYPALQLLDSQGRLYATICGPELIYGKEAELVELLKTHQTAMQQGTKLLAQADKATGQERAKLLAKAALLPNYNAPPKTVDEISKLDPKNETGYVERLKFNPHHFAMKLYNKTPDEVLAEVDKILANDMYNTEEKQIVTLAALGTLRRNNSPDNMKKLVVYAKKIQEIDPKSPFASVGKLAIRDWIRELRYPEGWVGGAIPADDTPVELKGKLPIKGAGTYTVTFNWKSGRHALSVSGVQLFDGNKKIAEDMHEGTTGHRVNGNVYTLTAPKELAKPRLMIIFNCGNKRDTNGEILIEKK